MQFLKVVPMLFIMGTIFFLSHQPANNVALIDFPHLDKLAHVLMYGVLGASVIFSFKTETRISKPMQICLSVILACTIYGLLDEFHQSYIPGRDVSGWDLVADFFGGFLVVVLYLFHQRRQERIVSKSC